MKIPIVLPVVNVQVSPEGSLDINIDGEPHHADRAFQRPDLRAVLDEITAARESAVRVQVQEPNGSTYADIVTPAEPDASRPSRETERTVASVNGVGFEPGEEVAIAYIVARRTADENGRTAIHLPLALLATKREGLVLLGLSSRVIATVE